MLNIAICNSLHRAGDDARLSDGELNEYQSNPVIVDAFKIVDVSEMDNQDNVLCALDNDKNVVADKGMTARYRPKDGEYWVIQSDGYIYLNPKDVFERKYTPLADAEGGEAIARRCGTRSAWTSSQAGGGPVNARHLIRDGWTLAVA